MIFVQGIDVLFKVALMLLVNHCALILQCNSFESVVDFLKTTLPEMVQVQMERVISQVSVVAQIPTILTVSHSTFGAIFCFHEAFGKALDYA